MATLHDAGDGAVLYVKGAPEAILARCEPGRAIDGAAAEVDRQAALGRRVLVFAARDRARPTMRRRSCTTCA